MGEGGKGDEVMSMANKVVVGEDLEARGVLGVVIVETKGETRGCLSYSISKNEGKMTFLPL
jgi:hypothetical protein